MRGSLLRVYWAYVLVLVLVVVHLGVVQVVGARRLLAHPGNPRSWEVEGRVMRGGIYDRNGEVLARSVLLGAKQVRTYPHGEMYTHPVGYSSRKYGRFGIEAALDGYLLGGRTATIGAVPWPPVGQGNNVVLTLDHRIQRWAWDALGDCRGAVVVLRPATGELLALVSKPAFDPNTPEEEWPRLLAQGGQPFLNRAVQGLYSPGSALKLVALSAAVTEDGLANREYECQGFFNVRGYRVGCLGTHGRVDLTEATVASCNSVFAQLALDVGAEKMWHMFSSFGFGRSAGADAGYSRFPLVVAASRLEKADLAVPERLAEVAIGQGRVLVSPLHLAMMYAAVANGGVMVGPQIVRALTDVHGRVLLAPAGGPGRQVMPAMAAARVSAMLVESVERGTGRAARVPGFKVAGKTGTAQTLRGLPHAWFAGFAPAHRPRYVVCVVAEHAGSGQKVAAAIAGEILARCLTLGEVD